MQCDAVSVLEGGARAMVMALVTVIDYFSDVVGFASKGVLESI